MIDDIEHIRNRYNSMVDDEDNRLVEYKLEKDITIRYLQNYLPKEGRVLEIGAATGAYTEWLAGQGYEVTAVDLSPNLISRNKERIAACGYANQVDFHVADARDISVVPGSDYDAVLLMGPLYHFYLVENRSKALQQAVGRLKQGGTFISAMISRYGILGSLMNQIPDWIERQDEVRSLMEKGHDPVELGGFRGYYITMDEIIPFHEAAGLKTEVVAGTEPAISDNADSYNRLEGKRRELWLDLLFEISNDPTMIASSRHLLYVGRKG
ncbi:MAG: class I SAM-dependent methyltransferase [Puniceicoccaceae bacterium]